MTHRITFCCLANVFVLSDLQFRPFTAAHVFNGAIQVKYFAQGQRHGSD